MEWNKIRNILEKYYDGETSLQEEKLLRKALQRNDCPEDLQAEAMLFAGFKNEQQVHSNSVHFEMDDLKNSGQEKEIQHFDFSLWKQFAGIAAMLAICGFIYLQWFQQPDSPCSTGGEVLAVINNQQICDQQQAKEEAKEALLLISKSLNESTDELKYLQTISTPQKITQ